VSIDQSFQLEPDGKLAGSPKLSQPIPEAVAGANAEQKGLR